MNFIKPSGQFIRAFSPIIVQVTGSIGERYRLTIANENGDSHTLEGDIYTTKTIHVDVSAFVQSFFSRNTQAVAIAIKAYGTKVAEYELCRFIALRSAAQVLDSNSLDSAKDKFITDFDKVIVYDYPAFERIVNYIAVTGSAVKIDDYEYSIAGSKFGMIEAGCDMGSIEIIKEGAYWSSYLCQRQDTPLAYVFTFEDGTEAMSADVDGQPVRVTLVSLRESTPFEPISLAGIPPWVSVTRSGFTFTVSCAPSDGSMRSATLRFVQGESGKEITLTVTQLPAFRYNPFVAHKDDGVTASVLLERITFVEPI